MATHYGSPIVDIRRVYNEHQAIAYVSRYLLRQTTDIGTPRTSGPRVYTSANWRPSDRRTKPHGVLDGWFWCVLWQHPDNVTHEMATTGKMEIIGVDESNCVLLYDPNANRPLIPNGTPAKQQTLFCSRDGTATAVPTLSSA